MPISLDDPSHPWLKIRSELRQAVNDSTWHLWLEPLRAREVEGPVLTLEAPEEKRAWIADRYSRLLHVCAADVLGTEAEVHVLGADPHDVPAPGRSARSAPLPRATADRPAPSPRPERLNPRLTFDQFVIGDGNRFAHAAALSVAELPALAYNPLFICGPPGLGKTHLLHSIANYVTAYGDGLTVRYTTVEAFTNDFLGALHGGDIERFKGTYRGADVLLVDDVQFLQRKLKTEEEFFHTFNELLASGAQVVLSSDRPPRDLDGLEDRLRERFEAGLVCDVRRPDLETRLTVLRKRAQQDAIEDIDEAALQRIAERVDQNLRALEGALIRVVAFGSLTGRPLSAELADEVLDGPYPDLKPSRRTVRDIQERVAHAFSVPLDELLSARRSARLAWPRQVAMYLARELTDQTLPAIGQAFGNRNHTTVMHACRRTAERMQAEPEVLALVERLAGELRGGPDDRSA